jgi:hypothetical protein
MNLLLPQTLFHWDNIASHRVSGEITEVKTNMRAFDLPEKISWAWCRIWETIFISVEIE